MFIKENFILTASNTDVLAAPSRLAAIPADGTLTVEVSAAVANTANNFALTIQLPGGDTPVESLVVPYNGVSATDSTLHDDTALQFSFEVAQGGHVGINMTETGTTLGIVQVTLDF